MNTQDLINRATQSEALRSPLGVHSDWVKFAESNGIEVMLSIWGHRDNPTKQRAIFRDGSERISRGEAERRLA